MTDPTLSPDHAQVTYTVKELLAQIHEKLDRLASSLDDKASQESVDHLQEEFNELRKEVDSLKTSRSQIVAVVTFLAFVIPLSVTVAVQAFIS